jgi:hypothetical protein
MPVDREARPIFVTATEGGTWVPWEEWLKLPVPSPAGKRVHAIMIQSGHIWDAQNGWRGEHFRYGFEQIQDARSRWERLMDAKAYLEQMRQEPEIFGKI